MGTRHIVAVVVDKKFKVAQYGQWDGYLTGQGITIAKFIEKLTLTKFKKFKSNVRNLIQATQEEITQTWTECGADPNSDFVSFDVAKIHNKRHPEFSRDTGAGILKLILDGKVSKTKNELEFVRDGLFCEYAYVLDLDKKVLEIYQGSQKRKLTKADGRFYKMKGNDGYSPVALISKVKFKDVTEKFMRDLNKSLQEEYL